MTTLLPIERRPLYRPVLPPPAPARRPARWRYLGVLLLGGYLLFAHGCHGDEDNELFASGRAAVTARTGAACGAAGFAAISGRN